MLTSETIVTFTVACAVTVMSLTVPCSAQSMVRNPGFEAGAEAWSLPAQLYSLDPAIAHAGKSSLRYHNEPGGPYLLASQPLPLQPGKCYRMSVWVKTQDIVSSDSGVALCLEWIGNGAYIGGSYPRGIVGTHDWQQIVFQTNPVPAGVSGGSVTLYGRSGTSGTAWFDDVEVTEADGPLASFRFADLPASARHATAFAELRDSAVRFAAELAPEREADRADLEFLVTFRWGSRFTQYRGGPWRGRVAEVTVPARDLYLGESLFELNLYSRTTGQPVCAELFWVQNRRLVEMDLVAPNSAGVLGLGDEPDSRLGVRVIVQPRAPEPRAYTARLFLQDEGRPVSEVTTAALTDRGPALVEMPVPAGLRRGNYDLRCELWEAGAAAPLATTQALVTAADPARRPANATSFGPGRLLTVGGKPFFPMGFYILSSFESVFPADKPYVWQTGKLQPSYYLPVMDQLQGSHFNCFIDYGSTLGGVEAARGVLDAAHARGLKAIFSIKDLMPGAFWELYTHNLPWKDLRVATRRVVRALREHPALVAWYINDEVFTPDQWQGAVDVFRDTRLMDPWHPTYAVHYDYKGLGVYREACDAIGTDPYTLCDDIGLAARSWRESRELIGPDKPFWAVVQCFGPGYEFSTPGNTREPTYDEERAATMAAIAEGATGIIYYCYHSLQRSPRFAERFAELDRIAAEVQGLVPIIALPDAADQVPVERGTVSALTKQGEGKAYVILASTERADQEVVLALPFAPRVVRDLTTGEILKAEDGKLSLRFRALDARVLELVGAG